MRRWMTGILTCLAACGGRARVDQQPAPVASEPAPVVVLPAPPPSAIAVPLSDAQADDRSKTAASFQLNLVRDSAADEAVLDSLATVAPAASLPDVPIESHATWDLDVADFADQPRVKYYLDYFVGPAHDRFQIWLQRMGRYETYARAQFTARKLPGDFVYLALIESGFSPEAVSRTAATGIWQFMPGTGRRYGLRIDSWVDERRDPIKATDAAAHHLADLTVQFGSNYLAAAAYNAGAGRVERGLEQMNAPAASDSESVDVTSDDAFFSLADTRMIRDETKNYVPQLIAAAILAKEPARYGFDAPAHVTPFSRDSVVVDGGTGLDLIARLADTTVEALRDLNPHLLRLVTPPGSPYPVRVPAGTAHRIAAAYGATPPDERHAIATHEVRRGETVAGLARHYGASATLIREANRAARGRSLAPGTVLYIPVSTTIPASFLREPDPPRQTRTVVRTYVVRVHEGIVAVARRAGVSVSVLRRENHLAQSVTLHAGERLTVRRTIVTGAAHARRPHPRVAVVQVAAHPARLPALRTHVVRRGETVGTIAQHYGIAQSRLIALNGLSKSGSVRAGQTLRIPPG